MRNITVIREDIRNAQALLDDQRALTRGWRRTPTPPPRK